MFELSPNYRGVMRESYRNFIRGTRVVSGMFFPTSLTVFGLAMEINLRGTLYACLYTEIMALDV